MAESGGRALADEQGQEIFPVEYRRFILLVLTGRITLAPEPPLPVSQPTIKLVSPVADFKEGTSQVMTGGRVTKHTLLFAATQHDEPPKPASGCTKHVLQAAQVENGDVEGGWFCKGYLHAGEDKISTSVTTLVPVSYTHLTLPTIYSV